MIPLIPRVTPNDLRRTFASLLVQGGTPLPDVARMMGHKGTETVFKFYGRDTPETLAARVALPCSLQPVVPPVYQTGPSQTEQADTLDDVQVENTADSWFRRRDSNGVHRHFQNPKRGADLTFSWWRSSVILRSAPGPLVPSSSLQGSRVTAT